MPFDGTLTEALTGRALYQDRRERAAGLWRSVPPERFCMGEWECGTTACALGWLARLGIDGWHFRPSPTEPGVKPDIPYSPDGAAGTSAAACYFGATRNACVAVFNSFEVFNATASEVADHLLALPYTVAA